VSDVLAASGYGGTDLVLRWLASFVVNPARPEAVASDVDLLLTSLPPAANAAQTSAQAS